MNQSRTRSVLRLTVALALASAASLLAAAPTAAAPVDCDVDTIRYSVDPSDVAAGATATAYLGAGGALDIPSSVLCSGQSYAVTTIGQQAFLLSGITSVTIPSSVTTIVRDAFSDNALTSVVIPDSVMTIGQSAFFDNPTLASVTLGSSVTAIGASAFSQGVLTSVTIPSSVTTIGQGAFSANQLTSLSLGSSVTTIGPFAFYNNDLTSVTIPSSVTEIGGVAFEGNPDLASMLFDGAAPTITEVGGGAGSLGDPVGLVVSYQAAFDAANVPGGFTTPTWKGYTTQRIDPADATTPTVTINQGAAQDDPTGTSPIVFDVEFSEPVEGFGGIGVSLSGTAGATTSFVTGSGSNYTVTVSGMTASGTVIADVRAGAASDGTNLSAASTSTDNTVTYNGADAGAPTVTINQGASQDDPTGTSPIVFDVEFSEPVLGFGGIGVSLSGTAGATTTFITGGGRFYTVAVSGMTSSGTVIADVRAGAATDGTNPSEASTSTDNTVVYQQPDTTVPTVTINQSSAQADPTGTSPIVFTAEFSEAVTGFTADDVTLTGTAGATTADVSGSGATYTISVSGMTSSGTVIASIPAGAATDGTHESAASTSTDNTVTYGAAVTGLAPTISGLAQVGQTLTAHAGPVSPSDAALTYQWNADGDPIANATGPSYKLKAAQSGKTITVTITASKPPLTAQTATSDPTPSVRDKVNRPTPSLDQTSAHRGDTVTLTGQGLTPGNSYAVRFDASILGTGGTLVGTAVADEYGEIHVPVTIPRSSPSGPVMTTVTGKNPALLITTVTVTNG